MKRFLLAVLAFAAAQAAPALAQDADPVAHYNDLLAAAKSGSGPVDWAALRYAYADLPDFDGQFDGADRQLMFAASTRHDWDTVLTIATRILDKNYVDGMAHHAAGAAELSLGRTQDGLRDKAMADAIFASIRTGDGLSYEHAFTVIAIDEEYDLLITMDVPDIGTQSLQQHDGHTYDVFATKDADGNTVTYYFNIDREWAAETRPFKAMGDDNAKQKGE